MNATTVLACDDKFRIVVDSIGQAGMSRLDDLSQCSGMARNDLERSILQAPSCLLQDVPYSNAQELVSRLAQSGYEVRLASMGEPFIGGKGDCELAISIRDYSRLADVTAMLVKVFGLSKSEIRRRLSSVPAILISGISVNNADILAKRFAEYHVEVDIVQPQYSIYDALVYTSSMRWRREILALADSFGARISREEARQGLCDIHGLDYEASRAFCNMEGVIVLNRAYQRYDIYLDGILEDSQISLHQLGIRDETAIRQHYQRGRSFKIMSNARLDKTRRVLEACRTRKIKAHAELTAHKQYQLHFNRISRNQATERLLLGLSGIDRQQVLNVLRGRAKVLSGPFNYYQARWLRYMLQLNDSIVELISGKRVSEFCP